MYGLAGRLANFSQQQQQQHQEQQQTKRWKSHKIRLKGGGREGARGSFRREQWLVTRNSSISHFIFDINTIRYGGSSSANLQQLCRPLWTALCGGDDDDDDDVAARKSNRCSDTHDYNLRTLAPRGRILFLSFPSSSTFIPSPKHNRKRNRSASYMSYRLFECL